MCVCVDSLLSLKFTGWLFKNATRTLFLLAHPKGKLNIEHGDAFFFSSSECIAKTVRHQWLSLAHLFHFDGFVYMSAFPLHWLRTPLALLRKPKAKRFWQDQLQETLKGNLSQHTWWNDDVSRVLWPVIPDETSVVSCPLRDITLNFHTHIPNKGQMDPHVHVLGI